VKGDRGLREREARTRGVPCREADRREGAVWMVLHGSERTGVQRREGGKRRVLTRCTSSAEGDRGLFCYWKLLRSAVGGGPEDLKTKRRKGVRRRGEV